MIADRKFVNSTDIYLENLEYYVLGYFVNNAQALCVFSFEYIIYDYWCRSRMIKMTLIVLIWKFIMRMSLKKVWNI